MSEEEKREHESKELMTAMGNKCLYKMIEACVYSALLMLVLYLTDTLKYLIQFMFPNAQIWH